MTPDNMIREKDGQAGRLGRLRPAWPPRRPSFNRHAGRDRGGRLARFTARHLDREPGASVRQPRFLVAHALWILAVTLVAVGAAAAVAGSQTPVYRSQADVVVNPAAASASSGNPPNMATEEDLVQSGTVLTRAAGLAHVPEAVLARGVSVNVPGTTTLLQITYSDPVPRIAQLRAQAVALAYVSYRSPRPAATRGRASAARAAPSSTPTADLVTPASLPASPSSPDLLIDIGVALIVGLALGIGTAMLRDRLDDRPRGPLDLEAQAHAPVLALIPAFRPRAGDAGGRLVMAAYPDSVVAEAYRGLRTRLVQAAAPGDAMSLLVTSPGWEDKGTVAANLAAALAQSGRSVILVSADLRWGRAHRPFGLDNAPGLTELLEGRADLDGVLRATEVPGLRVVAPGGMPADPAALLQLPAWPAALEDIQKRADAVVIEAPPILASPDTRTLADRAALILIVTDAHRTTRARVRLALREVEPVRGKLAGCVLGNVGRRRHLRSPGPEPLADGHAPAPDLVFEAAGHASPQGSKQ